MLKTLFESENVTFEMIVFYKCNKNRSDDTFDIFYIAVSTDRLHSYFYMSMYHFFFWTRYLHLQSKRSSQP